MKKHVGLVTWRGWGNFGTSLQSYALHNQIEKLGYKVYLIEPFPTQSNWHTKLKQVVKKFFSFLGFDIIKNHKVKNYKSFRRFNLKKYNIASVITDGDYHRLMVNTDVFMTGSDQIWNVRHSYNPFFFLNFVVDKKKVAYASSMGTTDFPNEYVNDIKNLLNQFKYIGVREKTAAKYLNALLCRSDIQNVLDPTFLLTPTNWKELALEANRAININGPYIFCYLIGKNGNYIEQVEIVRKRSGISQVVIIPAVENQSFCIRDSIVANNIGPKEFIKLLMNASYVCTDSFHATALSINFSKEFVEFMRFADGDSMSQNSRIYDLLNNFGLSYKLYSSNSDDWLNCINYSFVQEILSVERAKSLAYLKNIIEN